MKKKRRKLNDVTKKKNGSDDNKKQENNKKEKRKKEERRRIRRGYKRWAENQEGDVQENNEDICNFTFISGYSGYEKSRITR
jgi:hypothetical protein